MQIKLFFNIALKLMTKNLNFSNNMRFMNLAETGFRTAFLELFTIGIWEPYQQKQANQNTHLCLVAWQQILF